MPPLISLMTDFGLRDGFVGVVKAVILGLLPEARIVDLTHLISPQDVREAAVVLSRSAFYFPPDTIHVFVVDPGVGTARRPLAGRIGQQFFVGPDNGALTLVLDRAAREGWPAQLYHLNQPRYWRPEISSSFHGRDIFAPVAAHLARGVPLAELGQPIDDPVRLPLAPLVRTPDGLCGEVVHIDHFGNLATNIRLSDLELLGRSVTVRLRGTEIAGLVDTFGDRAPGTLIAMINSVSELGIAVVNGDARRQLGARVGDPVEVQRARP